MKMPRIKLDPATLTSTELTMDRISDALRRLGLHVTEIAVTNEIDPYAINVEIRARYQP